MATYTPDSTKIVHFTKVDLRRRPIVEAVHLVQYDKSIPILAVALYSDGQVYSAPDEFTFRIRFSHGDGTFSYNEDLGTNSDRTIVYFEVTGAMTYRYGGFHPIVEMRNGDNIVGTASFYVVIDRNPVPENPDVKNYTEYVGIEELVNSATHLKEDSEAWAVGERDGHEVPSTDPTYYNNSKYYAEEAADSYDSTVALNRESEAWAVGKRNGTDVPSTDPAYHNNSKYYAEQSGSKLSLSNNDSVRALTTSDNLNSITTIGRYYCPTADVASYSRNYPIEEAGVLVVFQMHSSSTLEQFYISAKNEVYHRYYDGTSFSDWKYEIQEDGFYEKMSVGSAEQLISTDGVTDTELYSFRTSGGSASIGNRENNKKIIGGTIAWNQLASATLAYPQGCTVQSLGNGEYKLSGTNYTNNSMYACAHYIPSNSDEVWINHKILMQFEVVSTEGNISAVFWKGENYITAHSSDATPGTICSSIDNVISSNAALIGMVGGSVTSGSTVAVGDYLTIKNYICIDLTKMFGSTIADYIYSLEQATAGAGIAWFKKLFPKPYYAYNAGELMSVCTNAHITRGFNAWDEEWEPGGINYTTGQKENRSGTLRTKNYIPILPDTVYFRNSTYILVTVFYDQDYNMVGKSWSAPRNVFTTPKTARYMRFCWGSIAGDGNQTVYKNDICINISWSGYRNGEYEPYEEHVYPLSPIELRGIPKLDEQNNLYYDGDIYEPNGTVTRKFGIVDLETLTWTLRGTDGGKKGWSAALPNYYISVLSYTKSRNWFASVPYVGGSYGAEIASPASKENGVYHYAYAGETNTIYAVTSETTTPSGKLVYELATPITESTAPYADPQIVNDFGTEEYVDALATSETNPRDVVIPVGHETFYQANLRDKLQNLPDNASKNGTYLIDQVGSKQSLIPSDAFSESGYYKNVIVGTSEQLISSVGVKNEVPYNFRTSGGSVSVGNRVNETVVGGTVVWNQLYSISTASVTQHGITRTSTDNGYILNGTSTLTERSLSASIVVVNVEHIIKDHVYLRGAECSDTTNVSWYDSWYDNPSQRRTGIKILKATYSTGGTNSRLFVDAGVTVENLLVIPICIDLTQMFGTTIANYIYSLEQSTAGAGVAWFKNLFPKPYYAYNAGELMSVCTNAHKMVGFNLFNIASKQDNKTLTWASGTLSSESLSVVSDYIRVVEGLTYHSNYYAQWATYDDNYHYLGVLSSYGLLYKEAVEKVNHVVIPEGKNIRYIRLGFRTSFNNNIDMTAKTDINFNLSWSGYRDGEYEPYEEHIYSLSPIELRGIPKLDAQNNLYYDGDIYNPNGTVTRKYRIVDLGSLSWSFIADSSLFASAKLTGYSARVTTAITTISSRYVSVANKYYSNWKDSASDKVIGVDLSNDRLIIKDSAFTSGTDLKAALSGAFLIYELKTPMIESADPYANLQIVNDFGTEEYADALAMAETNPRDVEIPVGHSSFYQVNLRDKLQNQPSSADEDGIYLISQTGAQQSLIPYTLELPDRTGLANNKTYALKVVNGTLLWVEEA